MTQTQTVVSKLDDFFGGAWTADSVDRLNDSEVEALAGDVDDFYRNYEIPDVGAGDTRSYSGGATWFSNIPRRTQTQRINVRDVMPFAHAAVLYSEQVVFDCPLDAWICRYRDFPQPGSIRANNGMVITPLHNSATYGEGFHDSDLSISRGHIKAALDRLDAVAPAIRSGWLLPVPHLRYWQRRRQNIITQVRHDIKNPGIVDVMGRTYQDGPPAVSDNIRGFSLVPDAGIVPKDQDRATVEGPSIYFNSVLAVAELSNSRFLPTAESDYTLLLQKIYQAAEQEKSIRDGLAVHALGPELMPTFDDETFDTVCEIRESSSAFAEWRSAVADLAKGQAIVDGSPERAQQVVDDQLREYCERVRSEIRRSHSLSGRLEAATAGGAEYGVDVALAVATYNLAAVGSIPQLVASISAPLLRRALKAATPSLNGSASVILRLDKRYG